MEVHDSKLVYVTYICGKGNCGKESKLKANDAVKCTVCGYRILYKKRIIDPKEPIQYEAIWIRIKEWLKGREYWRCSIRMCDILLPSFLVYSLKSFWTMHLNYSLSFFFYIALVSDLFNT